MIYVENLLNIQTQNHAHKKYNYIYLIQRQKTYVKTYTHLNTPFMLDGKKWYRQGKKEGCTAKRHNFPLKNEYRSRSATRVVKGAMLVNPGWCKSKRVAYTCGFYIYIKVEARQAAATGAAAGAARRRSARSRGGPAAGRGRTPRGSGTGSPPRWPGSPSYTQSWRPGAGAGQRWLLTS